MPHETLLTMLEAARWAASSFNAQPWRFVYALHDTPHWDSLLKKYSQMKLQMNGRRCRR